MHAQAHASFDAHPADDAAPTPATARAVIPEGNDNAPLRFVERDSGAALAYRPYRLHIGARLLLGRTDENGFTAQLSGAERVGLTDWEVE